MAKGADYLPLTYKMRYSPEEIYCSTPTVYSDSYECRKVRSYACPQFVLSDSLSRSSTLCPVRICRPWGCQGAIVRRIQCPLLRVVFDSRIHLMDTASSSKASADSFPAEESVRFRRHQRWLYIRIRHASSSLMEAFYSASDYPSSALFSAVRQICGCMERCEWMDDGVSGTGTFAFLCLSLFFSGIRYRGACP